MKRTILIAAISFASVAGSTSYGWDLFNPELIDSPGPYAAAYGPVQKDIYAAKCGCGPKYYKCRCPKPKYFVKVCRTRVKREKTGHGCHKKVCLVEVNKIAYRRVLHPGKYNPADVICALHRPPTKITRRPLCGCCGPKGAYGAGPYYHAPAPEANVEEAPLPPTPQ